MSLSKPIQTATPAPGQALTSPKLVAVQSRFGGQLGAVALSILRDLHDHPDDDFLMRKARFGPTVNLSARLNNLTSSGFSVRVMAGTKVINTRITNKGRNAIGVPLVDEPKQYKEARICKASMPTATDMSRYTHMGRVGLAAYGVAGR